MRRRYMIQSALALGAAAVARVTFAHKGASPMSANSPDTHEPALQTSKAEWRKLLAPAAYGVLFEENTERPGSSALNAEKRAGTFVCAACHQPLFDAAAKFESGTGWPSFFQPLPNALGTRRDFGLIWPRTEYHCARCGGHQGHVFNDGPRPTGQRYCNNGVALEFVATGEPLPALRG